MDDSNEVDLNKLERSIELLTKLAVQQQRAIDELRGASEFNFPFDPALYPKYQIDGITLSSN